MSRLSFLLCACLLLPVRAAVAADFGAVPSSFHADVAGPPRTIAFAPDSTWLVVGGSEGATVFDLADDGHLAVRGTLTGSRQVLGVAVSPDGRAIALVDKNGALSLFDPKSLQPTAVVQRAHAKGATAVTFTTDGSYVVSGGSDGKIQVWTPRGERFASLGREGAQHEGEVVLIAAASGRRVLSVGRDRQVILWDVDTQKALRPMSTDDGVRSAAFGGDGKTLALGLQRLSGNRSRMAAIGSLDRGIQADDTVRLVNAETGVELRDLEGERQDLDTVAVTPEGRIVAAAGGGRAIAIWDAASGKRITRIPTSEAISALAFSPDGRWLVAGTKKGVVSTFRLSGVAPAPHEEVVQPIIILIVDPSDVADEGHRGPPLRVTTSTVRVKGILKSSSPIKSLLVGDREITSLVQTPQGYSFIAPIPLESWGQHRIEIVAENEKGAVAKRSFFVERAQGKAAQPARVGRRLALIVGVSRYSERSIDLKFAADDARSLYDLITNPALGPAAFQPENVMLLTDAQATTTAIKNGLADLLKKADENDFVLFFFAGHGTPDPDRPNDLYLLAHDSDPQHVSGSGLLMRHVRESIAEIPARDVLVLTDACHSAGMSPASGARALSINPIHRTFLERMLHASGGLAILTASEAAQISMENVKWNRHGVFTYYLLEGLKGAADRDGDHIVTLGELIEYVHDHVRDATGSKQIPNIGPTSFDRLLPLAIVPPTPPPPLQRR